ncbi:MAG: SH3 domain-containing protein [Desulfobulbus sp.]
MHHRNLFSTVRACILIAPMVLGLAGSLEAKSIGKDQVNIRSNASLNSKIIFTVPLGYPIKVEKEANNWSFFHDWQNNSGWVYNPLISDIDTAVILVDKANVRSQATLKSKVAAIVEMGEIYTILAKSGNWVKLGYYHGGSELGWIRDDLVFGD